MDGLSHKLGVRIRYFRNIAQLSQGELAKAAQLTNGYLSDVERGKVNISITNLNQIAESLGIPLSVLLDFESDADRDEKLQMIHKELQNMPGEALDSLYKLMLMLSHKPEDAESEQISPTKS